MRSGRPAIIASASPGVERSAAIVSVLPRNPAGATGATMSTSVSWSIDLPCSARSRTNRSTSLRPTIPAAPMIKTCTLVLPLSRALKRKTAVDQMNMPGREARFVRSETDGKHRHFIGRAEPSHGLAIHEAATYDGNRLLGRFRKRRDAFVERGRLDGAGADRVRADAALDEIRRHRFGEPDHRRFRRA